MKIKYLLLFIFGLATQIQFAQHNNKQVLFTIDDEPIYASDFERVYKKNLDLVKDQTQKDVERYLELFINYKLKLKEAKALGLDKKSQYLREFNSYKNQLSKNYLKDNEVTDALVKEAYERVSNEVKARHILIRLNGDETPADTLKAYNRLLALKERIKKEGFETVQKEVHDGATVYAEDLGYFSGFKMVYSFENVAFNTNVGEVSEPFKTRFGYHIVEVLDKRPSRGKRTVAHIMIATKDSIDAEKRINAIYKKIQQGEDFEALAKQFSDDKSSSKNGGKIAPFASGELSSNTFEEVAFSLTKENNLSQPFKSNFGWHIVKLYNTETTPEFSKIKAELENKVKRDSRSELINSAMAAKLKNKYNVKDNPKALAYFASIVNKNYTTRTWSLPSDFSAETPLVTIGKKQLKYSDFGNYLTQTQRIPLGKMPIKELVEKKYEQFLETELFKYQEAHLEEENPEYAQIVSEYRDGLLLFDLMDTKIWSAAKTDTVGLKNFYEANKQNYIWNDRVDAIVASSASKKEIKKVAKLLDKNVDIETIKSKINKADKVNVLFTKGVMDAQHQALPRDFKFKKGLSSIHKHNNSFVVVKVNAIMPKTIKTFEEAKGQVSSEFQEETEAKWIKQLRDTHTIKVNQATLQALKSKLQPK